MGDLTFPKPIVNFCSELVVLRVVQVRVGQRAGIALPRSFFI
jgi:hypothetical protein